MNRSKVGICVRIPVCQRIWTKRIFQPPNLLKLNGENGMMMMMMIMMMMMMKGEKE